MLTVNAQSFESLSTLQWNGAAQQTNVVNSGELTAVIPASDIANSGTLKSTFIALRRLRLQTYRLVVATRIHCRSTSTRNTTGS